MLHDVGWSRIQELRHDQEDKTEPPGGFKAKVALAALRDDKTLTEIAQQYKVHPSQATGWKRQLPEHASEVFDSGSRAVKADHEPDLKTLHAKPGQLTLENAS